jgi:hypothetical protein
MIHFTPDGIFADTEEERLILVDRMVAGDPVVMGHILQWEMERKSLSVDTQAG